MRIGLMVLAGASLYLLLLPLRLAAQGARAELLASDAAASALSGDSGLVAALGKSLDRDGVLLWPGAPVVVGAEEAKRLIAAISDPDTMRLTWQPLGVELAGDSTLGVTWGVAVITSRLTPGAPHIGRYTAAWRRGAGRWTLSALLFTGVKPAATSLAPGIPLSRSPARPIGPAGRFVAADLAFARLAGDSGAVVAFRTWAAPEAIVAGRSGLLARGPDAIASGVAGPAVWRWHPVAAGSSRAGDLGWTAGEAVIKPETGEPTYSKYLTVWIRPPGRPIRFLTDGGNARPAAVSPR
jgi:ketosteroid isomerase-like protein